MSNTIFCLMGPTASGKTALACELTRHFPFEIISVDSALIYRDMNIATAKPEPELLQQFPHRLIDILDPVESYSAAQFCQDAIMHAHAIIRASKIPLLVGGTMMYYRALQQGLSTLPEADPTLRETLWQEGQQLGWIQLHQRLKNIDPAAASRIHPHDTQRIQRALEVYYLTGKPISNYFAQNNNQPDFQYVNLLLLPDSRAWLHHRIAERFTDMLALGFLDEVKQLIQTWSLTPTTPSMRSVGYRQAYEYLQNAYDYSTFCEKGVAATRQLAKRQLTWLRHWPDGHSFVAENPATQQEIMAFLNRIIDNRTLE